MTKLSFHIEASRTASLFPGNTMHACTTAWTPAANEAKRPKAAVAFPTAPREIVVLPTYLPIISALCIWTIWTLACTPEACIGTYLDTCLPDLVWCYLQLHSLHEPRSASCSPTHMQESHKTSIISQSMPNNLEVPIDGLLAPMTYPHAGVQE